MRNDIDRICAATLENNITWLASFGCQVRQEDNIVYIDHSELDGFSVRLILGPAEKALQGLQIVLDQIKPGTISPDIYIDRASSSAALRSRLMSSGFTVTAINATKFSRWTSTGEKTSVILKPAQPGDVDRWSSLYSAGFDRFGREAELDRYRWQISFNSRDVEHWFILREEDMLGVCQTCVNSGVTGIYSFTLKPDFRGMENLRPALRALRAKLTEKGEALIYFERLWSKGMADKQHIAEVPHGFKVIRVLTGYRRLH